MIKIFNSEHIPKVVAEARSTVMALTYVHLASGERLGDRYHELAVSIWNIYITGKDRRVLEGFK